MLVSHKHKFIYFKTFKTAGTSVETHFEDYCLPKSFHRDASHGSSTIIKPEGIVGGRYNALSPKFHEHTRPNDMKKWLGDETFNSYYKFCVVRNPYDREISAFFWALKLANPEGMNLSYLKNMFAQRVKEKLEQKEDLDKDGKFHMTDSRTFLLLDGEYIMDGIIRYEDLTGGIKQITKELKLPKKKIDLPHFKGEWRPKEATCENFYTDETRDMVKEIYQWELDHFDYKFPGE